MKHKIKTLLKKYKPKCDYLEIRAEEIKRLDFTFMGKELSHLSQAEDFGLAVRAAVKGGWGFCSFNSLGKLEENIKSAITQAKMVGKSKTHVAEIPVVEKFVPAKLIKDPRNISLAEKLKLFQHYNELIFSYDKKIINSFIKYFDRFRTISFANSEGTYLVQEKMDVAFRVSAYAKQDGVVQDGKVSDGSSNDAGIIYNLDKRIKDNCKLAIQMAKAPQVKGGKYTVIVDPNLGGVFAHEAFGHMSEADEYAENPQMKETFKLGKKLGSPILNIYDSGLDEGCRGYLEYDDEGVKTGKTYLIKKGILVGRLHTRESAALFGEKPTGNARAMSYKYPPICRMRNTAVEKGTSSFEELLQGVKLGVYAVGAFGGTGGEMFSFAAERGYMIRNGKVEEMVRDLSLSGNLFLTLKNIDKIGEDFLTPDGPGGCGKGEQFPLEVSNSAPHFRIKEATIGGI
jgi:TldD protein